ncbi:MAG: hypothetical protein B6I28_01415 [Fusobacteriia bacterium 4572_132]|nr:MAG: hypothetical protein B6I28_01415 [Fusobacteriia bacterium 4572_132]
MIKKVMILFFMSSVFILGEVVDEINFLKKDDVIILEKRLEDLKKNYDIDYKIVVSEEEKNNLRNSERNVIINLIKGKENKLKLRLKFSKDINILGYRDEVESLLTKIDFLVEEKNYLDLLYEITGGITDIISISEITEEKVEKKNKLVIIFPIVILISLILMILINRKRRNGISKKEMCEYCKIEMQLIENYRESKHKSYKVYLCKVCGRTKTKLIRC